MLPFCRKLHDRMSFDVFGFTENAEKKELSNQYSEYKVL